LLSAQEETELEKKSFESRKEIGNKKRSRGNYFFERQEYNFAIQLYRRALEYLDESEGGIQYTPNEQEATNAQLQELFEDRIKVYNNLAQAQIKIQAFDAALSSIDIVLRCQPNNVKALFRKAKIIESKADVEGAIALLRKAGKLDPENKLIQNELSRLILKSKREARNEKDLYKKMLGQVQKLDASKTERKAADSTTNNSLTDSRFKYWSYTLGSILVSIVGVAFYRYKFNE
jgi:FK506-binding protein 8